MSLLVTNVPWAEGEDGAAAVARRLRLEPDRVRSCVLVRKSLDARRKRPSWKAAYRVDVSGEAGLLRRRIPGVRPWSDRDAGRYGLEGPPAVRRTWPDDLRPIVVGAGPAGLFAALHFAEAGAPVTLVERGGDVDARVAAVNGYWRRQRPLDPESNLLFGEGGAGTFSDGKVYTRRRDGELGTIFRRLVDFGADEAALQEAWAHLGTDRIRALLPPFRDRLRELGAEIRYDTAVRSLIVDHGRCRGVVLADGTAIESRPVLVATGHSARDAVRMLLDAGAAAEPRGIAVGARIEHPQTLVDRARYGTEERGDLPPATYRLSLHPGDGSAPARSFCMCPGGMIVPAAEAPGRVVVNGMSFAARRGLWANSAIIVEMPAAAYGADDPMAGFRWQDEIERNAFDMAGGTDAAPAQRVVDFLARRVSDTLPRTSYPLGIAAGDLHALLGPHVAGGIVRALHAFASFIPGFAGSEALLVAPESRTTSPVRFLRDDLRCSATVEDLFPIGEGAGYAGGIISSALDGLRAAKAARATQR